MDNGRLSPPPLEDAGEAISAEELRLLTAPPVAAAPDIEPEEQAQEQPEIKAEPAKASAPHDEHEEHKIESDEDGERAAAAARLTP